MWTQSLFWERRRCELEREWRAGSSKSPTEQTCKMTENPGKLRCLIVLAVLLFVIFAENMHIETYVSVLKFNSHNKKA